MEREAVLHKFVLVFTLVGSRAWASDSDCGEPLFACETANRKVIRLCAVEEETGRRWSRVQYRFGLIDKPEFVYPADSSKGPSSLFFSHYSRKGVYEVNVRFRNADFEYLLASVADARGDGLAEVTVSKGGRRLSTIACIERPWIVPIALQRTLACDQRNRYGAAACSERPVKVR